MHRCYGKLVLLESRHRRKLVRRETLRQKSPQHGRHHQSGRLLNRRRRREDLLKLAKQDLRERRLRNQEI